MKVYVVIEVLLKARTHCLHEVYASREKAELIKEELDRENEGNNMHVYIAERELNMDVI